MFRAGETGGIGGKSATGREQGSHVTRVTLLALVVHHSFLNRLPFARGLGKMGAV
jgi:hypothetical protein